MDLAPSLPPSSSSSSPDECNSYTDNTGTVQALSTLAVLGMLLLHVLGSLRRQSSNGLLRAIVMGVYTLSYPLVTYTIGLMNSSNFYFVDFAVWAVCLLLLLSSADSLTVYCLDNINGWKSIYIQHLYKAYMVASVVMQIASMDGNNKDILYLWCPLMAIMLVGILRWYVRIASMRTVSKPYLAKNVKVIAEYMQRKDNMVVAPCDPVTMEGYRYMVAGEKYCVKRGWSKDDEHCLNKVTTVEQIWRCKGNLLHDNSLKDLCLSMALSKMLNRRFAGFKLSEAHLDKTHDFLFRGLLTAGDEPHQRAFRVIEEELVFVHDLYYTRYSYLYQKCRYLAVCLPIIMFGLCSWLMLARMLLKHKLHNDHQQVKRNSQLTNLLGATMFITAVLAFLEAYQLYLCIASGWFKVALIRSYVSYGDTVGCCLEMIIGFLLRLKALRPWKGTLGQYCLLSEIRHTSRVRNCPHYATLHLVDKAKKRGRKSSVKLSEDVKRAIVDSLLQSNGHLTNGVTSLQNNGVHAQLLSAWACEAIATDGTVTRTILVWHIATTLCQQQLDAQAKEEEPVKTASTLSKYCMHLLAFEPNLLPDHSSISESILDESMKEVGNLIEGAKTLEEKCKKLMQIGTTDGYVDEGPMIIGKATQLANYLIHDIKDPTLRWKVLSDFLAEKMLYVSPSDDARAHLETLARVHYAHLGAPDAWWCDKERPYRAIEYI